MSFSMVEMSASIRLTFFLVLFLKIFAQKKKYAKNEKLYSVRLTILIVFSVLFVSCTKSTVTTTDVLGNWMRSSEFEGGGQNRSRFLYNC